MRTKDGVEVTAPQPEAEPISATNHQAQTSNGAEGLAAVDLRSGYGARNVLDSLSVRIDRGGVTALVGPNGSGKSTFLKTLSRLLKPSGGAVYLDGKALTRMPTAAVAREIAILPQGPVAPAG